MTPPPFHFRYPFLAPEKTTPLSPFLSAWDRFFSPPLSLRNNCKQRRFFHGQLHQQWTAVATVTLRPPSSRGMISCSPTDRWLKVLFSQGGGSLLLLGVFAGLLTAFLGRPRFPPTFSPPPSGLHLFRCLGCV